jgi:hypothetical protein
MLPPAINTLESRNIRSFNLEQRADTEAVGRNALISTSSEPGGKGGDTGRELEMDDTGVAGRISVNEDMASCLFLLFLFFLTS